MITHNKLKIRKTTLKKLITESKVANRKNSSTISIMQDSASDNVWDGFLQNTQSQSSYQHKGTNVDHRQRAALSHDDRNEMTNSIWSNQIEEFITSGTRNVWCFKK